MSFRITGASHERRCPLESLGLRNKKVGQCPLSQRLTPGCMPGAALISLNLTHKKYYGKRKMRLLF